jgi:predicted nucleic acid-binding protein
MNFVLDASIALSWCFPDEITQTTIGLLESLAVETAFVPAIWSLELGNALLMAERKKRIKYAEIVEFLSLLQNINIQVDDQTDAKAFHETFVLAYSEGLTTYDASYLELAMRKGLPIATKDNQLSKIAKQLGINVIR